MGAQKRLRDHVARVTWQKSERLVLLRLPCPGRSTQQALAHSSRPLDRLSGVVPVVREI